jgi:hypothetical protein
MKTEEILIELLGDKYAREILSLTSGMECSALLLCREPGIPLATVDYVGLVNGASLK